MDTNMAYATVEQHNKVCLDQAGHFPVTSLAESKYISVLYIYDANAILAEPLKGCTGKEIAQAYKKVFNNLEERGFRPETHWLDNEISNLLKSFNANKDMECQLVPPGCHR